jgi:diacylglycerol kinase (ATP)
MASFFARVTKSFGFAGRGLVLGCRGRNFRIMLVAGVIVIALGVILDVSRTSWAILLVCIAIVLGAEAMNTAIEKLADQVEQRFDHAIGDVKDVAAGAVLLVAVLAAVVGLIVFWPYVTS